MSANHDELLVALAAGEISPEDPAVRALLASGGEAARAAREWIEVRTMLDASAAREERDLEELLDEATARGPAPDEPQLLEQFRRITEEGAASERAPRRTRTRPLWAAAAALVGVLLAGWWSSRNSHEPEQPRSLGPMGLACEQPRGEVEAIERFVWSCEQPAGLEFRVLVRDAAGAKLWESDLTPGLTWTPTCIAAIAPMPTGPPQS